MPYTISLNKLLENKDPALHARLSHIETISRALLCYTQGKFPYYTPHDFSHSLTVEENLNWIIPDDIKNSMNNFELFFLIVSAWLHDWGMIGDASEDPKEIRDIHHIRTEEFFESLYDKVGLSINEARIIGKISKGHRKINLYSPEYNNTSFSSGKIIRVRFLSALLRLADEVDITFSRTPEIIYYSINPTDKAEEEFRKHLSISGVRQT